MDNSMHKQYDKEQKEHFGPIKSKWFTAAFWNTINGLLRSGGWQIDETEWDSVRVDFISEYRNDEHHRSMELGVNNK